MSYTPINCGKYHSVKVLTYIHKFNGTSSSSFEYGNSKIHIFTFKRGTNDDPETSTDYFERIENSVVSTPDNIKSYFFNTQIKKIRLNNRVWIDSVVVSKFESGDRQMTRSLLSSTDDYFICVSICLKQNYQTTVFNETPNYFIKSENGSIIWDYKNDKIELFAANLVNGKLESKVANEWYKEATKIRNSLKIE